MSDGPVMELTEYRIRMANGEMEIVRGTEISSFSAFGSNGKQTVVVKAGADKVGEFFGTLGWFSAPRRKVLGFEAGFNEALSYHFSGGQSAEYNRGHKLGEELCRWRAISTDIDNGYLTLIDDNGVPKSGVEKTALSSPEEGGVGGSIQSEPGETSEPSLRNQPEHDAALQERFPFEVQYTLKDGQGFGSSAFETAEEAHDEYYSLASGGSTATVVLKANGSEVITFRAPESPTDQLRTTSQDIGEVIIEQSKSPPEEVTGERGEEERLARDVGKLTGEELARHLQCDVPEERYGWDAHALGVPHDRSLALGPVDVADWQRGWRAREQWVRENSPDQVRTPGQEISEESNEQKNKSPQLVEAGS